MAEIQLEKISKSFDDTTILKSIDLKIADGEFLVLVGPSGCGKSTLLRMIAGLEDPSGGDILIDGRSALGVRPKDRNLAMVFQSYALYPHMTVAQNMGLALKIKKVDSKTVESEVQRVAEILGLEKLLKRKPGALSGGQRQRVAMGRAIVRNPRAFLFDEPLSNLDAALRSNVRTEIKKLHQDLGTTTIYVTHDQTEAMTLADRIVVMKGGIIQQVGTPIEIFNHPANDFVAGFMGSPKMNFLEVNHNSGNLTWEHGSLLSPELSAYIRKESDCPIRLGVRPEHIHIEPRTDLLPLGEAEILVQEPLGTEMMIVLDFEGQEITLKTPWSSDYKTNQRLKLFVEKEDLHFFSRADGSSLTPNRSQITNMIKSRGRVDSTL